MARVTGVTDHRLLRLIAITDIALAPGLLHAPERWQWLAARAGVNALVDTLLLREPSRTAKNVEAHVHGGVRVPDNVEAVVLDPSHRRTATEDDAHTLGVQVQWHSGFRVGLATVRAHPAFRGTRVVEVAESVAQDGWLDARVVGETARTGQHQHQDLKKVWHHLVRWGRPALPGA